MTDRPKGFQAPRPSAISVEQQYKVKKSEFEKCFVDFHALINDKVLEENKSPAAKSNEHFITNQLVKTAVELDTLNAGEGPIAIAVIALREHLKVRDRINELEYELEKSKREVSNLKKELGINEK